VALLFLLTIFARAQDSQFLFDPNGNLFVQTGASTAPPQIIGQPQNRMVAPGDSASFFVVAKDTRALTYQWRFNGANIPGATNDAVLLQNISTNNEGEYRGVLTNPSGSVTSAPALLIIDSDADGVGDSWELTFFGSLTNSASVDTDGDGSSNLHEFLDDTNPANATSVLRHLTIIRDGGAVIANPNLPGYTNGQTVTLTATALPGEEPFHAWLGDVVTRSHSITLVMTNNKTLHARFTPIVFTWTNSSSGDWDTVANWSPNLGPGSNDTVNITKSVEVSLNTPAHCADVTLGDAVSGPTLTGSGTLAIRGNFVWVSGNMTGSGRTVVESGGTMQVVSPSGLTLTTRTLENGGTALWTGAGNINMAVGAVITNRAGALFQVQNAASLSLNLGNAFGRFDNAGAFRKSASAGTTSTGGGISFNNSGVVEIQAGALDLGGGGTHSGSFDVSAGTALLLSGTHTAGASSSVAGAGQFIVRGGAANLAGFVNVSGNHTFSGGTATFTGNTICTNNTVTISGGTASFSSTGLVSPAVMSLTSGALDGAGTVTVNSLMNWTGGEMTGSGRTVIQPGATLNVSSPSIVSLVTRTLENGGTVQWTGAGNLALFLGAVITNRAGALFHARNAAGFGWPSGPVGGRFDNAGTFRKSVNSGATTTGPISFNNHGTVDIRSGAFAAQNGYNSAPNALLNCALGGINPGTGYGQLQVAGAVTLNGALSVDLINGFVPATNDTFAVVTAGTRNGTFANFSYPSNAAMMQLSNTANSVIVRITDVFIVPQPVPVPAGLISWWRAEGNAFDSAGANHGVLTNGATFAAGNVGQSFAFDGVNDFVIVPDSPTLRPSSITLEAWAMFNAPDGPVFTKPLGAGEGDSFALFLLSGTLHGFIHDINEGGVLVSSPSTLALGQWHHVAFTFDDSTKEQALYINGARVATSQSNRSIGYDNKPVLLGHDINFGAFNFPLHGRVDEASIYNRALTGDEMASIYNAGSAGKQPFTPYQQWKQIYLGDSNAPDSGDPDNDGFNNLAEYTADTNPTNAASQLRIIGVQFVPTGIAFQWQGGTLATQFLQCSFDLGAAASWTDVFTNLPPTASPSGFAIPPPTNATQFYRLRVVR
jgi:hypothetical protein